MCMIRLSLIICDLRLISHSFGILPITTVQARVYVTHVILRKSISVTTIWHYCSGSTMWKSLLLL